MISHQLPGLEERAYAKAIHYRRGSSSNSSFEFDGLLSQSPDNFRQHPSQRSEKVLADSGSGLPRLGPLVRPGLCQGLWSIPVLVPPLLVMLQKKERSQCAGAEAARFGGQTSGLTSAL